MAMIKRFLIAVLLIVATVLVYVRCKQPYFPPVSSTTSNFLVVEGTINVGTDSTIIKLSRTVSLSDSVTVKPETGANITLDNENNTYAYFREIKDGYYYTPGISNPNYNSQYRLKIVTKSGKAYQSGVLPIKNSPPVDSLYFEIKSNGVQIYSATHDPANNTKYYRWDYNETWKLYSEYDSVLKGQTNPDTIVYREGNEQLYYCWPTANSSSVIINTSSKLANDVIEHNPVAFISSNSRKFELEYSILVHQHALSKEAFEYWQNLKKNTEQLGSIFDAQPSQLKGNIHSVSDTSETVLGYISMGAATSKRIFIGRAQLPYEWEKTVPRPYSNCMLDTVRLSNLVGLKEIYQGTILPINKAYDARGNFVGYSVSTNFCTDCRLNGGTNIRPSFWIDKL